jgi:hypothetical protein
MNPGKYRDRHQGGQHDAAIAFENRIHDPSLQRIKWRDTQTANGSRFHLLYANVSRSH